jgi:hypothetical protein
MTEQKTGPEPAAGEPGTELPDLGGKAEGSKSSEEKQKVTPRMSVEEHLAGLWKVLGLGD